MIVKSCTTAPKQQEPSYTLSYSDIQREEGVYEADSFDRHRLVVLRHGELVHVLFSVGYVLQPAGPHTWSGRLFRKVDADVIFEIREKK